MGMFDLSLDNLFSDDPKRQAMLTMAMGLLGGSGKTNKNFAADLGNAGLLGMQAYGSAQKAERENRQNELTQISGTYKTLKDIDNQARLEAALTGAPYSPHPMLAQIESRLGGLAGRAPMPASAPSMPAPPAPTLPAAQASQYSPVVRPELQAPGPMPQPQAEAPKPNLGQLADMAGVPRPVAQGLIASGKPEKLMELIAEGFKVRGSGGNFMRLSPTSGQMEFLGGQVTPGSVPVSAIPGGGLQAQPVKGLNEAIGEQQRVKTEAEERAKSQFEVVPLKMPDGRTLNVTKAQLLQLTGGQQPQGQPQPQMQIPPQVQGQRDNQRMQILLAERDSLAKQGRTDPALEQEIKLAQGGVNFAGQRSQYPGFVTGQSTAQQTAAETNPKLQLEELRNSFVDNSKANDSLQFLDASRQALKAGTFTGALSSPQLLVSRFGAAFGIGPQDKVANSEVFMAMAGRSVMGAIKSLGSGSGISDADREYAAKAMGGSLKLNEQTIGRLLDIQEKTVKRGIDMHNSRVDQAESNGVPEVFSYKIKPYETVKSSETKEVSFGSTKMQAQKAPNGKFYIKSGSKYYEVQE